MNNMSIQETTFGPKRYLTLRKSIAISQVSDHALYDEAGKKLGGYLKTHNINPAGPWTVLYFKWDQAAGQAELGISFPVEGIGNVGDPELELVDIAPCKAFTDSLHGPYSGLGDIHRSLMAYAKEKNYDKGGSSVLAVEEYVVDSMSDTHPTHWVTKVYYLHS